MSRQAPLISDSCAPAVDRAVDVLQALGAQPQGLGAQELVELTATPRATLYRILKVLLARGFVQATPNRPAHYRLGPALALLGGQEPQPRDLVEHSRPVMQRLAHSVRETIKLVAVDGLDALTLAVADTGLDARVTARIGTRMPLHIGASQRLLLAHLPGPLVRQALAQSLEKRTTRTMTDPALLRASLMKLRQGDSAQGQGEGLEGVGAAATLVRGADDVVLGALVAVYIHVGKSATQLEMLSARVQLAAQEMSSWHIAALARPQH